jgi:hypothetical protein
VAHYRQAQADPEIEPNNLHRNGVEQFLNPISRSKVARAYRRHFDHLTLNEFHLLALKKAPFRQQ